MRWKVGEGIDRIQVMFDRRTFSTQHFYKVQDVNSLKALRPGRNTGIEEGAVTVDCHQGVTGITALEVRQT